MKCALITIGNELLSGMTVNTNAAWIGNEFQNIGVSVNYHVTIPDEIDLIKSILKQVAKDHDIVITTGGLGPTHDDITPTALYEYFNSKLTYDEEYWEQLKERFNKFHKKIPELNRSQVIKPHNGIMIPNPVGSARGLHFVKGDKWFFSMPGVPAEMKGMMSETIIPMLKGRSNNEIHVKTIRITGVPESGLAESLDDIIRKYNSCSFAFYPNLLEVNVRITSSDISTLKSVVEETIQKIGDSIFGFDDDSLESVVGKCLSEKGYTISTAESCTGGLIGHRLTEVSGSSEYYLGGIVSYSNMAKMKFLNVKEDTLNKVGAVSSETAAQMAEGVRKVFESDIGISVTGIAGPGGGTDEKPIGTVYFGLALPDKTIVKHRVFGKNRTRNKQRSSQYALNMIRLALNEY